MLKAFPKKKQSGVTLIELLVGGSLGVLVLVSVIQAFSTMKDNSRIMRSVSDLQESGWAAVRLLERDIHMAAFAGCATGRTTAFTMHAQNSTLNNLYDDAIRGYSVTSGGKWKSGPSASTSAQAGAIDPVPFSDVISISRAASEGVSVVDNRMTNFSSPIVVTGDGSMSFEKEDYVLVSDCNASDVFRVTNEPDNDAAEISLAHDNSLNDSGSLSRVYLENAQVRRFFSNTYYVGETGRRDASGQPVTALYRLAHGGDRVELVQGVETLQVRYGERLNNGNIRYSDVNDHTINWGNVTSVRLSMLVSGMDRVLSEDDTNTYQLTGTEVGPAGSGADIQHPSDRKLRRVFSTTIFIQNKLEES